MYIGWLPHILLRYASVIRVFRLVTLAIVSGLLSFSPLQERIIKKAFGKLKLEHVVIGKGQFEQERAKPNVLEVTIWSKLLSIYKWLPLRRRKANAHWKIVVSTFNPWDAGGGAAGAA